ncbi:MAG TPA: hypothetical protein DEB06_01705 [Phycisphaerales bacterium]|nr:hypothetical protein [Phycisphaerales bacterium]
MDRDVLLVLREAGERTRDACLAVVRGQIDPARVRLLRERPFSAAVRRGLEIGAAERPRWLFTLDADVLLAPRALEELLALCEGAPPECFHVKGLLVCRVMGGTQPRGFHAFRGSLVPEALRFIAHDPATLRPETSVVRRMEASGHPSLFAGAVLGLHDFEQSFRHLYIKMLLRARKTGQIDPLRARLARLAPDHPDLRVALWGLDDAPSHAATREFDWDAPYPALDAHLRDAGLREKNPLDPRAVGPLVERECARSLDDGSAISFPGVVPGGPPLLIGSAA